VEPEQQGWYTDPWGRHEARWISQGVPSKLVRDGGLESYDDPPDAPPTQAWVPINPSPGLVTAADILRADAAEAGWTPTLAELSRKENSAALTAQAHPWFIARNWVRSSVAEPISATAASMSPARRAALIGGGVVATLILLISTYLWVVEVIAMLTPPPPIWGGALMGSVFVLAAPVGTYLIWRSDRRADMPIARRLQRAEVVSGLLGLLMCLVFVGSHLPTP
jgi:hypothetical protein